MTPQTAQLQTQHQYQEATAKPFSQFTPALVKEVQNPITSNTSVMITPRIKSKLEQLMRVQGLREGLEKEEETLKSEIKEWMGERSTVIDKAGKPLLSYKEQVRIVLDTAKFKTVHPDLFNLYSRQSMMRPFRVLQGTAGTN